MQQVCMKFRHPKNAVIHNALPKPFWKSSWFSHLQKIPTHYVPVNIKHVLSTFYDKKSDSARKREKDIYSAIEKVLAYLKCSIPLLGCSLCMVWCWVCFWSSLAWKWDSGNCGGTRIPPKMSETALGSQDVLLDYIVERCRNEEILIWKSAKPNQWSEPVSHLRWGPWVSNPVMWLWAQTKAKQEREVAFFLTGSKFQAVFVLQADSVSQAVQK